MMKELCRRDCGLLSDRGTDRKEQRNHIEPGTGHVFRGQAFCQRHPISDADLLR